MEIAHFQFVEDCRLECPTCAHRLRRALQRVSGIEEIRISVNRQRISIGYNGILIDYDALGEKLADFGYVVRGLELEEKPSWY